MAECVCAGASLLPLLVFQYADNSEEDAEEIDISLSTVSLGVRPLCNLRFADDIDLPGGSEEELQ